MADRGPQITAIMNRTGWPGSSRAGDADGGSYSGDITKAIAAGCNVVMTVAFCRTEESPGESEIYQGRRQDLSGDGLLGALKEGLGSLLSGAGEAGAGDRGVGSFPGTVEILFSTNWGLRAGMGYRG